MSHSAPLPINFDTVVHKIMREQRGRLLAILIAKLGDIELAEDALQDALCSALSHWHKNGLPACPEAWLLKTAKHKAIDRIRRAKNFAEKQLEYQALLDLEDFSGSERSAGNWAENRAEDQYSIPDERLRLIFTCCHPALEEKISVALTLQLLGGLSTDEIARAFLIKKETMAQRLVRGKAKIKASEIPYIVPETADFSQRLNMVLTVLYLIFNEGYSASSGEDHIREELCAEAIRLTQIFLKLCPQEPEVGALLALMLLHDARRPARRDRKGAYVSLEDQDRSLWLQDQITKGSDLLEEAMMQGRIGSFQLQAAISALHSQAAGFGQTPWAEIKLIYDEIYKIQPTNVIKLNRAVALSYAEGAAVALIELKSLEKGFESYQPFFAVRADLYKRNKQPQRALKDYQKAIDLSGNRQEKNFLQKNITLLTI